MTPDREKVIKELESLRDICNAKFNMAIGKGKVAWAGYANTADDALKLLKEQQETISSFQGTICKLNAALEEQAEIVRCGECIYHHYENNRIPYCELIDYGYGWQDDDFCSRGKRR